MRATLPGFLLLLSASIVMSAEPASGDNIVIVHFGDSTCITSYLPKEQRIDALLNAKLKTHYKSQSIVNHNVGLDGDYIRQFLDGGRYKKHVQDKIPHINIALIRYGQNDMKKNKNPDASPELFRKHLEELCDKLLTDYPGVQIVLETNTFVDPAHGGSEWMNKEYNKFWEVHRQLAKDRKYPLVENFNRRVAEVAAGRWDLSIRNQALSREKFKQVIVDDSKDKEMEGVKDWFADGHPNPNAVIITAEEEFKTLTATWPEKLPVAKGK